MSKRSSEKRITRRAQIVRYMRQSRGMSLNQAARIAGVTGPAIAHMEGGRMDISNERLTTLLRAYAYTSEEFESMANGAELPVSHLDECIAIVRELDEPRLRAVHGILVHLVRGTVAQGTSRSTTLTF